MAHGDGGGGGSSAALLLAQVRGTPGPALATDDSSVRFKRDAFDTVAAHAKPQDKGKIFYECTILEPGSYMQIGWVCAPGFDLSINTSSGKGVGDDDSSWSVDGVRVKRWVNVDNVPPEEHRQRPWASWGTAWRKGDILGVAADLDTGRLLFGLNGCWEAPMGVAFSGGHFKPQGGVFPAVSGMAPGKLRLNLGDCAWAYGPPDIAYESILLATNCSTVTIENQCSDLAARLYVEMKLGNSVAELVESASAERLTAMSTWKERCWQINGEGKRQFLWNRRCQDEHLQLVDRDGADFATNGACAFHVLVRDCTDETVVAKALDTCGVEVLQLKGGLEIDEEESERLPIHFAVENANVKVLQLLIGHGGVSQLDQPALEGCLPVHVAAIVNTSTEVWTYLLDVGPRNQLLAKTEEEELPLHFCAGFNPSVDVLQILLSHNAQESVSGLMMPYDDMAALAAAHLAQDKAGMIPLHYATQSNPNPEILCTLLASWTELQWTLKSICETMWWKSEENVVKCRQDSRHCSDNSAHAECQASNMAQLFARELDNAGYKTVSSTYASVNAAHVLTAEDKWAGKTPLHFCAQRNSVHVMKVLLGTSWHYDPADVASDAVLREQKIGKSRMGMTCMYDTAEALAFPSQPSNPPHANVLLNAQDKFGKWPIHFAARFNEQADIMRLLLVSDEDGLQSSPAWAKAEHAMLPIHFTAQYNSNVEVLRLLVDAGGQDQLLAVDSKNGRIPLHFAAGANASIPMLETLLESGEAAKQLTKQDNDQKVALHWAAQQNTSLAISTLLTCATQVGGSALHDDILNSKDRFGQMPMHSAAKRHLFKSTVEQSNSTGAAALKILDQHGASVEEKDHQGRTVIDIALGSSSIEVTQWAHSYGSFLERYLLDSGPCVHRSASSKALFAQDTRNGFRRVALKLMKHRAQFEVEISARYVDGRPLAELGGASAIAVIRVIAWHTTSEEGLTDPCTGQKEEPEPMEQDMTTEAGLYKYMLVMDCGERSLHDACAKERLAGYDSEAVVRVVHSVAVCVQALHSHKILHGDLKQRNILRVTDEDRWTLCDMDGSARVGSPVGAKSSSAYMPPELARHKYAGVGPCAVLERGQTSFDVWSFGVVLYELCAGRTLFSQDMNNDSLVEVADRTRLCVWHTISAEELDPVFAATPVSVQLADDARNLIRWCLKGQPSKRPSMTQVLAHRFFTGVTSAAASAVARPQLAPPPMPMQYFAFMSHAQADASGTVGTLYLMFKQLGLHNWLDMRQDVLTLDGMRAGVWNSRVFLLVLSERVLSSWFCQQEMLTALDAGKHIQLVLECGPRFHPFDLKHWLGQQRDKPRTVRDLAGNTSVVPQQIVAMVDEHLPEAVTYRRRDFEAEAMMRELCKRCGLTLPCYPQQTTPDHATYLQISVIYAVTAETIVGELIEAIQRSGTARIVPVEDSADRVLLVLSGGVLALGSTSLMELESVIEADARAQQDRITAVYSEEQGWSFGCDEQRAASQAVQACLNEHEAIAYRRKDLRGRDRHEHPAMIQQLLLKLGVCGSQVVTPAPAPAPTIANPEPAPAPQATDARAIAIEVSDAVGLQQLCTQQQLEIERLQTELQKLRAHTIVDGRFEEGLPPQLPGV
eukprot:COSAG01_NODE_2686_length_7252_cov_3.534741_1_plen_1620_part_00